MFKLVQNLFKCVQMGSNLFKTCSNEFKCVQTGSKLVQMCQMCSSLSKTCSNVFKIVQKLSEFPVQGVRHDKQSLIFLNLCLLFISMFCAKIMLCEKGILDLGFYIERRSSHLCLSILINWKSKQGLYFLIPSPLFIVPSVHHCHAFSVTDSVLFLRLLRLCKDIDSNFAARTQKHQKVKITPCKWICKSYVPY